MRITITKFQTCNAAIGPWNSFQRCAEFVLGIPTSLSLLHELTLFPMNLSSSVFSFSHRYPEWGKQKRGERESEPVEKRKIPKFHTLLILFVTFLPIQSYLPAFSGGKFSSKFSQRNWKIRGNYGSPDFPQFFHQETREESWEKLSLRSSNQGMFLWVWDRDGYFKRRKL